MIPGYAARQSIEPIEGVLDGVWSVALNKQWHCSFWRGGDRACSPKGVVREVSEREGYGAFCVSAVRAT
jgi:hypothetical protein